MLPESSDVLPRSKDTVNNFPRSFFCNFEPQNKCFYKCHLQTRNRQKHPQILSV